MSGSTITALFLLSAIVLLLGTITALVANGLRRLRAWSPQVYEQAFREMMRSVGEVVTSYAQQTAALEQARQFQASPELLAQAPARIQEIGLADWLAAANSLSVRLEIVRRKIRAEQPAVGSYGETMFLRGKTTLQTLEEEEARLQAQLDQVRQKAEAYERTRAGR
jgi:hypothetical protein